jgi:hypothetical protein
VVSRGGMCPGRAGRPVREDLSATGGPAPRRGTRGLRAPERGTFPSQTGQVCRRSGKSTTVQGHAEGPQVLVFALAVLDSSAAHRVWHHIHHRACLVECGVG